MRIVGGKHKGQRIFMPKGSKTRPIANKAKERLFAVIDNKIPDTKVLDLYAGTGSIGIEALSRGAKFVTFVEVNYHAVEVLTKNITSCKELDNANIIISDSTKFLKRTKECYDLIFSAPPYRREFYLEFLNVIDDHPHLLKEDGSIIIECDKHQRAELSPKNLSKQRDIFHGDTIFEIWSKTLQKTLESPVFTEIVSISVLSIGNK